MATQNMQAMQLIAPDIAQEQMQLSRRQQIADILRKQSLEPAGSTETIGGWAIKKSPFEALGKMAQALSANYVQDKTDTRQLELAKALQGRMGDILGGGSSAQPQMENRTDAEAMGPQAGMPIPSQPGQPAAPANNFTMANLLRGQVIGDLGGQGASASYWDSMKSTDAAKRDRELGIASTDSRASELAKRLKEGTMSLLPGQTNMMPDGGRIVAPNFETGVAGGFNAQGQPVASEIPGSSIIAANRAGGIKRAEAGISDVFAVPAKVDAVGGPVAMTPAQQRSAANNGIDPANPKPARSTNSMVPQSGDADRAMIYQAEMQSANSRLASARTPEERARAQSDIEALGREAGRIGIKLQDDSSRKFGEQVANKSADALLESRDKAKAANDSLMGIQQSRRAIAGGVFQGSGAEVKLSISKFINANIPGVNIDPEKVGNTDYLKSTLGAGLLAEAKTLGTNPSNTDAKRIDDIVGNIGKDPNAMKMILDWRQEMAERSIKNHNATVADAEKRGMSSPYELRVNGQVVAETPTSTAPTSSTIPKSFASLPNPADFNGKRMRAPDGSVIRSNGKTWVKE